MDKRVSTYVKPPALSPEARILSDLKISQDPMLCAIPMQERPLLALNLVEHAAVSLGQKQVDEAVNRQAIGDLVKAFDLELSGYTAKEVQFIFSEGAKGKLGIEAVSVSTATIFKWIKAYKESYKPKLNREIKTNPIPVKILKKPEFTKEQREKHLENAFKNWKADGKVYVITYDHLKQLGKINLEEIDKWELVQKAIERLTASFYAERQNGYPAIRNAASHFYLLKICYPIWCRNNNFISIINYRH